MDTQPTSGTRSNRGGGTLVEKISEALREAIAAGAFQPGEKLPSEAKLTQEHGVSRTVVREAIAALRADRLVEARQGAGVFVRLVEAPPALPFQNIDYAKISSILEILELRAPVEIEAAGLAAQRRSPVQEEDILSRHRAIEDCVRAGQPTAEADFALHRAIAEATNNPRFGEFLTMMGIGIIPRTQLPSSSPGNEGAVNMERLQSEHEAIVGSIIHGDVEAAREAMRIHLQGSARRYRNLLRSRA
ncbi:FadR/GntR family transcriptional regulator [Aureimonas populi]|uniref:FadR/GntR family transcriptional regulator n=2 Tax=Aureimonas populi TaxID=1701758 RepID=A0ABW5CK14_9HYPH|nr:FadR/GntR family transcriptional regulator [Aureimonas populi]